MILKEKELKYIEDKGMDKIHSHACDFIRNRIAAAAAGDVLKNGIKYLKEEN